MIIDYSLAWVGDEPQRTGPFKETRQITVPGSVIPTQTTTMLVIDWDVWVECTCAYHVLSALPSQRDISSFTCHTIIYYAEDSGYAARASQFLQLTRISIHTYLYVSKLL